MKYIQVVAIVIESGAIYSVSLITLLILYCRKTGAQVSLDVPERLTSSLCSISYMTPSRKQWYLSLHGYATV